MKIKKKTKIVMKIQQSAQAMEVDAKRHVGLCVYALKFWCMERNEMVVVAIVFVNIWYEIRIFTSRSFLIGTYTEFVSPLNIKYYAFNFILLHSHLKPFLFTLQPVAICSTRFQKCHFGKKHIQSLLHFPLDFKSSDL